MNNKKAVVLISGGLDSATVAAVAKDKGFDIYALSVNYGQRHSCELLAAEKTARQFSCVEHKFVSVDLSAIGGSALTDNIDVPQRDNGKQSVGIPITYVPARNTIFLSISLGYAEVLGARDIFIGVNAIDYSGYPDCRPEFIEMFQNLASLATKAGIEGNAIKINAPLIDLTKPEIISLGLSLDVDYSLTHSCYSPSSNGKSCGRCDSCIIRLKAFADVGVNDPIEYAKQ